MKKKTISKHTIRVFVVFNPDGSAHLAYIHHNEDHPTEDSPGQPVTFLPGEQVRWKSMSGAPISIHFKTGSPFVSGVVDLPTPKNPPRSVTEYETVKQDVPGPGGNNPDYKYTVTVQGVPPDDPDVIIDLSGGGGAKPSPKPKPKTKPKPKAKPKK